MLLALRCFTLALSCVNIVYLFVFCGFGLIVLFAGFLFMLLRCWLLFVSFMCLRCCCVCFLLLCVLLLGLSFVLHLLYFVGGLDCSFGIWLCV